MKQYHTIFLIMFFIFSCSEEQEQKDAPNPFYNELNIEFKDSKGYDLSINSTIIKEHNKDGHYYLEESSYDLKVAVNGVDLSDKIKLGIGKNKELENAYKFYFILYRIH